MYPLCAGFLPNKLVSPTNFDSAICNNFISPNPPFHWVLGVKWQGRDADNSLPTSAEVKKMWTYTSTPHTPS
jgi:hypothetical protein